MALADIRAHELVRKAIHLSSGTIPLMYWYMFDRSLMLKIVIFMASGFLLAEYLRFQTPIGNKLFTKIFGSALRQHEYVKLTGATYVFTGAVLAIFLFPREIAVPALLILSFSDTFAALIGIPFGKHRFLAKSVEGSTAFFVVTLLILWLFYPENYLLNIPIAGLLTVAEAYPSHIDDNFLIPMVAGILLTSVRFL